MSVCVVLYAHSVIAQPLLSFAFLLQLWNRMNRAIGKTRGGMKIVRFSTGSENYAEGAAAEVERIVGVDIPSRDIGKRACA